MLFPGAWVVCDDRVVRPVITGRVLSGDGAWVRVPFLVDTGADRTTFSAEVWDRLGLVPEEADYLSGVGGHAETVVATTPIQLMRDDGIWATFNGRFAAFTDPDALDMSVLGRDVTNLFALEVDRPQDVICLLGPPHRYAVAAG
jgi:hypothetical protein